MFFIAVVVECKYNLRAVVVVGVLSGIIAYGHLPIKPTVQPHVVPARESKLVAMRNVVPALDDVMAIMHPIAYLGTVTVVGVPATIDTVAISRMAPMACVVFVTVKGPTYL